MSGGLTREQKRALARTVWSRCGDFAEFWGEMLEGGTIPEELHDADPQAVFEQLSRWLRRLPGDTYDLRLPDPGRV